MESLHVEDKFTGGLVYNIFLMLGAVLGATVIDKMPRRVFLVGTFYLATALLALLTLNTLGSTAVVLVFGLFALVLSAAANLEFIYPPELFPTHLRASGVGLAVAASRIGSEHVPAAYCRPGLWDQSCPRRLRGLHPGRRSDMSPVGTRDRKRAPRRHRRRRTHGARFSDDVTSTRLRFGDHRAAGIYFPRWSLV
jgi:hypothetical protein